MTVASLLCPFCERPAVQTVMLSLALAQNIAVCADEGGVTAAGSVLLARASG